VYRLNKKAVYLILAFILALFPIFIPQLELNKDWLNLLGIWSWSVNNMSIVLSIIGIQALSSFSFSMFFYLKAGNNNTTTKILYFLILAIIVIVVIMGFYMVSGMRNN